MYSNITEEEDNNMAMRCQKDADGILIFVSPRFVIQTNLRIKWDIVDWFVLCCSRRTPHRVCPGPEAESSS
jgi:hypothetical protein